MDKDLQKIISEIPQENILKFFNDLMTLANFAKRVDYDDYELHFTK